jgi:acetylornithine deacetylase
MDHSLLYFNAIELLKSLIQTPSFSRNEESTALIIGNFLTENNVSYQRHKNNLWATNKYFDPSKPSLLINSHHDTVRPNQAYTLNPFDAKIESSKLYGLGSNDAGASLVSLLVAFLYFFQRSNLKYNIIFAATAEEEISGKNGMYSLIKLLPKIDFAIVGEPTDMQMATAEKGLIVIDAYAYGIAGHVANDNTENAIYTALNDISWIRNFNFPEVSSQLGAVKMSVSQIDAGEHHNVIPAVCHFVIDVRINEHYSNQEVFETIDRNTKSKLEARSFHLNSSNIEEKHPLVQAGLKHGLSMFGSPTLSDQVFLNCPSIKMGPGKSLRSHSSDEFVLLDEIREAIDLYIKIMEEIV